MQIIFPPYTILRYFSAWFSEAESQERKKICSEICSNVKLVMAVLFYMQYICEEFSTSHFIAFVQKFYLVVFSPSLWPHFLICKCVFCYNFVTGVDVYLRGCIQKFADWVDSEIYAYNNKHLLRSNTKGYGGKTHWTHSQNNDTTPYSGRELYHL
jgi:hypothetical protein